MMESIRLIETSVSWSSAADTQVSAFADLE
jgi:hypothetical protein